MPRERTHWEGCWKALSHHNCALDRIAALEADLERERIRLAACGVVAGANTRDSAAKVRQMSPEYRSASLDDVERAVDREIAERERREDAEAALSAVIACHNSDPILIAREPGYRWHDVIKQAIAHFSRYKD